MGFGPEIIRGVRLAAIVFAVGLISLVAYRMLDLDTDDEQPAAPVRAVPAAVPTRQAKTTGQGKLYPPPPPPLPGRVVAAKPVKPQGRDIVVIDVPSARESFMADASVTAAPDSAPAAVALPVAVAASAPVDVAPAPPVHHNRLVRSVRKLFHLGK